MFDLYAPMLIGDLIVDSEFTKPLNADNSYTELCRQISPDQPDSLPQRRRTLFRTVPQVVANMRVKANFLEDFCTAK
jgi:hypothetical protein